jgi:hypothetical protein
VRHAGPASVVVSGVGHTNHCDDDDEKKFHFEDQQMLNLL